LSGTSALMQLGRAQLIDCIFKVGGTRIWLNGIST
jgi:hypothetical protein